MNNGKHSKNNNSFEWWYFHFISEECSFNFIIHLNNMYGLDSTPYMSLSICNIYGESEYYRQNLDASCFNNCIDTLSYKNRHLNIQESFESFHIDANFDNLYFNAIIYRDTEPTDGIFFKEPNTEKSNSWNIVVPKGRFKSYFKKNKHIDNFSGYSYHDHNWGDSFIQNSYKEWAWGNIQFYDGCLTYYLLISKVGEEIKYIHYQNGLSKFLIYDFKYDNLFCQDALEEKHLYFVADGQEIIVRLKNKNTFKTHKIIEDNFCAEYERSTIVSRIQIGQRHIESFGINEVLKIF